MRLLLTAALILLLTVASPALADTHEQNDVEARCMALVATDYLAHGVLRFGAHFEAYALCAATWWISWLPEGWQGVWWRWQFRYSLDVLTAVQR